MWYVLNFEDHTFRLCESKELVLEEIERLKNVTLKIMDIEGKNKYTANEFIRRLEEL